MTLKLWTSPLSWNGLRPELVLAEKGIVDVERIPADLIGGKHKASSSLYLWNESCMLLTELGQTEEFREKSIFGKVPLLEDGDVAIFESRAIARYLCLKYADAGPKLMPERADAQTSGVWEMWLTLEAVEFDAHVAPVVSETLIRPAIGKGQDEAVLARHRPRLVDCLDVLDKALSKMPYMGGNEYSLVDIFYMPCVFVASRCFDLFEGRPNLKKWWETVSAREAWKKAAEPLDDGYRQVIPGWTK